MVALILYFSQLINKAKNYSTILYFFNKFTLYLKIKKLKNNTKYKKLLKSFEEFLRQ